MIVSFERSTGMGARHGTQIQATNGEWYFVSDFPAARKINRMDGFNVYVIHDHDNSPFREYHRSNSGNVTIADGFQLDDARYSP